MKRFFLSLISIVLACAMALCAVNQTLLEAQADFNKAKTVEDYVRVKKKFHSAYSDVGYVEAEHKEAIERGERSCDEKISQLSGKLTVNGSTSATSITFGAQGGSTTLPVSTNQGSPTVKSNADWLTIDSHSATSITISCAPNSGPDSRKGTVTVSAGKLSVRVNATQDGATMSVSTIDFGSTDGNGKLVVDWGQPMYADAVCYVKPRITYNSPAQQTKTLNTKIYKVGNAAPDGYTQTMECTLEPGTNTLQYKGYGNATPGNWEPGTYAFELWVDGQQAYTAKFDIRAKFDGIKFNKIEFGSIDDRGNTVVIYGNTLYNEDVRLIRPRISYVSPVQMPKMVYAKLYKPDGSLVTMPNSPAGHTLGQEVNFRSGENTFTLDGAGWSTPQFEAGKYNYEIWIDGERAMASSFNIKPKGESLVIKDVRFGATDYSGNWVIRPGQPLKQELVEYITPQIFYSSTEFQKKKVHYKYFDKDGTTLLKDGASPAGYSHARDIEFKQGNTSTIGQGRGKGGKGKFTSGKYRVEIWIDGKLKWSGEFEIR